MFSFAAAPQPAQAATDFSPKQSALEIMQPTTGCPTVIYIYDANNQPEPGVTLSYKFQGSWYPLTQSDSYGGVYFTVSPSTTMEVGVIYKRGYLDSYGNPTFTINCVSTESYTDSFYD